MPTPSPADIEYLKAHPEVADKFRAHFGMLPEDQPKPKPTPYDVQYLVDNPQTLPKFEDHFGPIASLIPKQQEQQAPTTPQAALADEGRFLGGRLLNAAISVPGIPADLVGLGLKGLDYLGGVKTPTPNPLEPFTSETIRSAAHDYGSQAINAMGGNTTPQDLAPRDPRNLGEKIAGNVVDFIGYGLNPSRLALKEAASGGAALTAAQELAPDNPIAQLAAAYLGHRAPANIASRGATLFPAAKAFLRGTDAAAIPMQEDLAALDRLSAQTGVKPQVMPGQISGDYSTQQVVDALIARSPGGQPEVLRANESLAKLLDAAVKDRAANPTLTATKGAAPTESSAGNKILSDFEGSQKRFRERQTKIEDYFQKAIGAATRVPMPNTLSAIGGLNKFAVNDPKIAELIADPHVRKIAEAIQESGGSLSYEAARALKTDLGELLPKASLATDVKGGQLKLIYGALANDIGAIAKARGLGQPWERYNKWASDTYEKTSQIYDRIVKPGDTAPEAVARRFLGLDATALRSAMRNITPEGRAQVAGLKLIEAAKTKAAGSAAEDVTTSYLKFLSNISEMKQDGTFNVVFGAPQFKPLRQTIDDLERVSKNALKANKVSHDVSGATTIRYASAGGIGYALMAGDIPTAAAIFGFGFIAPKYAAKALQSRAYLNWLSSVRHAKPGDAKVLAQRLTLLASRDRDAETREALKEFAKKYEQLVQQMSEQK